MIFAVVVIVFALPITAAIVNRKQLKLLWEQAKLVVEQSEHGDDSEEENREFALFWYHAGAKAFHGKDLLMTDLTIAQKFNDEWDALDDESDQSQAE